MSLSTQLKTVFEEFRHSTPKARKEILPRIEYICSSIYSEFPDSYVSEKCTKLIRCCKDMARLKQPKSYNEEETAIRALGDIMVIHRNLPRKGIG